MGCGISGDKGQQQPSRDENFCSSSPLPTRDGESHHAETKILIPPCEKPQNEMNPSHGTQDPGAAQFDVTNERRVDSASPKLKRQSLGGRKHSATSFTSVAIRGEMPITHRSHAGVEAEEGNPSETSEQNAQASSHVRAPLRSISDLDVHRPLQRRVSEPNFIAGISADTMAVSLQRHSSVDLQSSPSAPFNFNDANSAVVTTSSSFSTRRTNASMASLMPPSVASTQVGDALSPAGSYQQLPISIPSFTQCSPAK